MATQKYLNYVAGEWVDGATSSRDINPSDTSDVVADYAQADKAQTETAIEAARAAAAGWAKFGVQARADLLDKIGQHILARSQELGALLSREEGKTLPEGIGEVVRAANIFRFFGGEVLRHSGELVPSVRPGIDVELVREPLGVVGIIAPWNFPAAIPAWKCAPALAYGNCVVFKPADLVPGTAHAMAQIIVEAGVPEGVFNFVMGRGSVVGETIVNDSRVDAITFTGSVDTGRKVAASAVARMAKFQLEMGGKNPLVVLDDADLKTAVECAVNGAFFSTGQRCTASSRLVVTKGIHDKFVAAMIERLETLTVDNALNKGTDIGPVVDKNQLNQDLFYIEEGKKEGAKLAYGGNQLKRDTEGFYLEPALFTDTSNDMRINREEVFGPVATVIAANGYDEALAIANDTPFGLSSGICTSSLKHAADFRKNSQAGMVMVNLPTAGVDYHVPFGGRKGSSYGPREQGRYAQEFYTTVKTSYVLA
ncbi:MAG: aldehyde dehydrogenase family protein [Betaproteobacteria bacterium]|jgi:aldehyde dehydrogenase (NAD+)|nr:MAG: aldehyde dehydrogenase family protein [Betaproteobacteria bacterium]